MLVSLFQIIHLQIVNRAVRHLSPASLAIAHTFGFVPHSARSYLRNSHATTGAFPRTASRSVHTVETLQATVALSQTPLCPKQSTSAVSTELYERGLSEHSTPALQPFLSVLSGGKSLAGNNQLSLLSVFYAGILDKTLCGTCIHTACGDNFFNVLFMRISLPHTFQGDSQLIIILTASPFRKSLVRTAGPFYGTTGGASGLSRLIKDLLVQIIISKKIV